MQYLVLIYEDESRFANGFPEAEFAEYGAFGKKHASRHQRRKRFAAHRHRQDRSGTRQPRCSPPMVPSRRPRSSLVATT